MEENDARPKQNGEQGCPTHACAAQLSIIVGIGTEKLSGRKMANTRSRDRGHGFDADVFWFTFVAEATVSSYRSRHF